nr:hypothetical protein [uncultured Mediterranean phage uvMED]
MKLTQFTDHELALLADALYWKMNTQLKAGLGDSPRFKTLQGLQDRILSYLQIVDYDEPRKDFK